MALPVTKAQDIVQRWGHRLADPADQLDEFTVRRALHEARAALGDATPADRGVLFRLIGVAEQRLGHKAEALSAHRNAVRYLPESAEARLSLSASLISEGQSLDALAVLQELVVLLDRPGAGPSARVLARLNLAAALSNLGRTDDALDAYQDALGALPPHDADTLLKAALSAADLGLHGDAVELVARYLCAAQGVDRAHDEPALAVIDRAPADHVARLTKVGALGIALDAVRAEAAAALYQGAAPVPRARLVVGSVASMCLEKGREFIELRVESSLLKLKCTKAQVDTAVALRNDVIACMYLASPGQPDRVLWLKQHSEKWRPSDEAVNAHVLTRWDGVFERLAR